MSNDMTVGRVYSTTTNHPSGITEVLLEKTERERDEAIAARKASAADWLNQIEQANVRVSRALQQTVLAERERDHYKSALEEISTSIDDWLNSLIQEPSLDFIHAIKAYAQKKLNEI